MKITKNMTIKEILKLKPKACNILMSYGLKCAHCELGAVGTLKEGCRGHGLSENEVITLVEKLEEL